MGLSGIAKIWFHWQILAWAIRNSLGIAGFRCVRANKIIGINWESQELTGIDWKFVDLANDITN